MGTSLCHMILSSEKKIVEGMCGVVADGIIPGYYGYEAGQPALGDIFAWFVNNAVPARYEEEARQRGISVYDLWEERAAKLAPESPDCWLLIGGTAIAPCWSMPICQD